MDDDGKCTICQNKCDWKEHSNMTFYFQTTIKQETGRADKIYEAYLDATSQKSKSEQILEGLKNDLNNVEIECMLIQ